MPELTVDAKTSADDVAASGIGAPRIGWAEAGWTHWNEWLRLWGWGFLVYTFFVVLTGARESAELATHGQPIHWGSLLTQRALEEYTCALFVPPLFFLVRQWPIERDRWKQSVPVLFMGSLLFVILKYTLLYRPLAALLLGDREPILATLLENTVPVLFDFWGVIGVAHAVAFYQRAQDRERLAIQLKARLSQAQLEALKSQLHPHFLFNTLNSVATLLHRDPDAADRMVTDLADLLRTTLQHPGNQEITLAEELALLERYVGIVRVRFRDRLTVVYDVPVDLRDALVPLFLLQPLVENALEHGIARRPGPGRLEIAAQRTDGDLHIAVSDDGPGLRLEGSVGHGVGLANTRARLAELYGSAHRLTLEAISPAGGARALVVVPLRRRPPVGWERPTFERASSVA
jgi:two-component system LytT family sensor kinase